LLGDENKRPKMTAKEALDIYLTRGNKIFDISFYQRVRSAGGLTDEKYSVAELDKAMKEYFGDAMLSDFVKPSMITAYDFRNRQAQFFTSAEADSKIKNFKVVDVPRATPAAPTYFEPVRVKSELGTPYSLVDGGVFANNPAMCAYSEARNMNFQEVFKNEKMPVEPSAKDMIIVSLGTGSVKLPYYFDKMKNKGQLGWVKPIIDILMSSNSETVHYQLLQVFSSLEDKALRKNYYRLEPSLFNASSEMDDASLENLEALHEAGLYFIDKNADVIEEIIEKLIQNG
jgi:patatin-like phospholipase/acyl hydrolase